MKSIISLIILISCCVQLHSVDLPVFYRAPLYCGATKKTNKEWQTSFDVRYVCGKTSSSYNRHGNKVSLFGLFGKTDITRLGIGVQNKGPLTAQLWPDPPSVSPDGFHQPAGCFDPLTFNNLPIPQECEENDGLIEFCGKIRAEELALTFEQVLSSGFYGQIHVPIRKVCINHIGYKHCGKPTVNGINIDDFVNNDLPIVLQEIGYDVKDGQSLASYGRFEKSEVPDVLLAFGWGGFTTDCGGMVSSIRGAMQIGMTIPIGEKKDQNKLFAIPLGYDAQWGVNSVANLELGVYKFLVMGVRLGATIFFNEHRCMRMKTDVHQSGWLVLDHGIAHIKKGTVWDVNVYARADKVFYGLSAALGYSFTREEATKLCVRDNCFLKSVVDRALVCQFLVSRSYVASHDDRLKAWQQQVIHGMVEYDFSAHNIFRFAPVLRGEIAVPFDSKRTFAMTMYGVTGGLTATWSF